MGGDVAELVDGDLVAVGDVESALVSMACQIENSVVVVLGLRTAADVVLQFAGCRNVAMDGLDNAEPF